MAHILIIDDDVTIGNMEAEVLEKAGYRVSRAYSGTEALMLLKAGRPDLVLLDLMLPGLTGEELLPKLAGIPVIVVSAKADVDDKVGLLLGGAADYVTKPFHTKELLARIAAQLRAAKTSSAPGGAPDAGQLAYRNLRLDPLRRILRLYPERPAAAADGSGPVQAAAGGSGSEAMVSDGFALAAAVSDNGGAAATASDGQGPAAAGAAAEIRLTPTETAILKLLMQNPSQVIPKSLILERISDDTPDCTEVSLKMHVSNLRKKLKEAGGRDCIEAVWGIGFRLI